LLDPQRRWLAEIERFVKSQDGRVALVPNGADDPPHRILDGEALPEQPAIALTQMRRELDLVELRAPQDGFQGLFSAMNDTQESMRLPQEAYRIAGGI